MKNENIGAIGEAFIQNRLEWGIDFDAAWDDWQRLQQKLMFVIVDCPEVQFYDDRSVTDRLERQRIREMAKAKLGDHIRSADVSLLSRLANWAGVSVPVRPYHMDRIVVAEWVVKHADAIEFKFGFGEKMKQARDVSSSDEVVERIAQSVEVLVREHGLWGVPQQHMMDLYVNHCLRCLEASFKCDACGNETKIPVDHSLGRWQEFRKVCPACQRENRICLEIHNDGLASVLCSVV